MTAPDMDTEVIEVMFVVISLNTVVIVHTITL